MTNTIKTPRLYLKPIDEEDQAFIYNQFSNDVVNQYLFDAEPLKNMDEALEIIHFYKHTIPKNQARYMMILKNSKCTIGTLGYHAYDAFNQSVDIGYDLHPDYTLQGYMHEALAWLIAHIKETLNVQTIHACIYKDNTRSIHAVKRFGFTYLKDTFEHFRGQDYLHHIYQLKLK